MNTKCFRCPALMLALTVLVMASPAVADGSLVYRVGYYPTQGSVWGVAVRDQLAFLAEGDRMEVVSIAVPSSPSGVSVCSLLGAFDVAVWGQFAYVAGGWGAPDLEVVNISNPARPWLAGSYDAPTPWAYSSRVAAANDVVMLADGEEGILIFDATNAPSVTLIGGFNFSMPYSPSDVAISGDLGFAAAWGDAQIFDVSGPSSVSLLGRYLTWPDGTAGAVAVEGDVMCVAGDPSLFVVNVADPANPVLLGTYGPIVGIGVAMSGNLVFVADAAGPPLDVIDISDPAHPTLAGQYPSGGFSNETVANLVLLSGSGLEILKTNQPVSFTSRCPDDAVIPNYSTVTSYSLTGFRITNAGPTPAAISYWVDSDGPATLVDKGNPAALAGVTPILNPGASYYPPDAGLAIPAIRDYSVQMIRYFVEDDSHFCETRVIFEPPVPVLLRAFEAVEVQNGVELTWDVYSDDNVAGFRVFRRLDTETTPQEVSPYMIPFRERAYVDRTVDGGRIYQYELVVALTDGTEVRSGTITVRTVARTLTLQQNVPNPFNPTTSISFVLPTWLHARLTIYDSQGRLVRRLLDDEMAPGYKEVTWEGTNDLGNPVASGVYFCELRAGKQALTRKMVLLK